MDTTWNELLEFETRDLVDRYITKKHGKKLSEERVLQITSNFVQARDYFISSEQSNFTVRPLLQYYGVMALSKGLILSLNLNKTEAQLKGSHGLEIKNWNRVLKNKNFEELEITIRDGTFLELIEATENKNYLRANSSAINYGSYLKAPLNGSILTLKQVIQYFPDLKKEYYSWIEETLDFAVLQSLQFNTPDNKVHIKLEGVINENLIELLFPKEYCPTRTSVTEGHSTIIKFEKCGWLPNITQKWHGVFNIGDSCIIPTLPNDIGLNLLGGMYMISYVFGMMARYYPTTWVGLKRIEKGDKMYPFVYRILDFINDKYPKQVLDFLNSPYDFEKNTAGNT